MDNASKALIMAGAVLIAVMIVSLGVIFLNSAKPLVQISEDTLTAEQITAFNAKFTKFSGAHRTGSDAKSALIVIQQHNASADFQVNPQSGSITSQNNIDVAKKYTIIFGYNDNNGLINTYKITQES